MRKKGLGQRSGEEHAKRNKYESDNQSLAVYMQKSNGTTKSVEAGKVLRPVLSIHQNDSKCVAKKLRWVSWGQSSLFPDWHKHAHT